MNMDIYNMCLFLTSLIGLITPGRTEILYCGIKLKAYDTARQKCDNGIVLPLSTTDEIDRDIRTELPKWYLCGPSATLYDVTVYECIDDEIVLKNITNTAKDISFTTSQPDSSPYTDSSSHFIVVVAVAVCIVVLVCLAFILVLYRVLPKYYFSPATDNPLTHV